MKNKHIVTGVVGLLVGCILGFFVSLALEETREISTTVQTALNIPEDHPSPDTLQKLRELEKWARENLQEAEVRAVLGNFYYDMGRFDSAIKWYEESLTLEPDNTNIRTDLGTSYLYTGNPIKAVELYQLSLEAVPDHPQTLFNIGVAYSLTGDVARAIETWERLLQVHPDHDQKDEIQKRIDEAKFQLQGVRS